MQIVVFSALNWEVGSSQVLHAVGHTWHQFGRGQLEGVGTWRLGPLRTTMEASLSRKRLQRSSS